MPLGAPKAGPSERTHAPSAPKLPAKNFPAKIRRLKTSGKLPTGLGIPPLEIKVMLESNPLKSRSLVR